MSEIISDKGIKWLHNEIETLREENKALKESRDELLEALDGYVCIKFK